MIHDLAMLVQKQAGEQEKHNSVLFNMVLWLNMVLAPRMIWENKREPLAKFLKEPERATFPRMLCCLSQGSQPNTTAVCGRILTKMRSCIRVIAWANHGEFTTTAHFSTANWQVRIAQRLLTDQDSTNEKTTAHGIPSYETNLTSDSHGYAVCVHKLSRTES